MSNQWNNNQFMQGLPSQGNQVKMFDPTQFKPAAAFGGAQTNKPRLHSRQQSAGSSATHQSTGVTTTQQSVYAPNTHQSAGVAPTQHAPLLHAPTQQSAGVAPTQPAPTQQTTQSSWSSWSSWDWNSSETANPQIGDQQQNQQVQQPETTAFEHQQVQNDGSGGNQYYNEGNYTGTWNQGWDAGGQYSQPQQQIYAQPDTSAAYQSQELQQQPQWGDPQYGGDTYAQGTFDQAHYNTSYPNPPIQQQSLQNQQSFTGQFYDNQQQLTSNQVQGYHEQYQGQTSALYNQQYDANTWTAANESGGWGSSNQEQPQVLLNPEDAKVNEQHQLNNQQMTTSENIPQPSKDSHSSHDGAVARPSYEVYSADDDGTVSEYFGRDDDGDVQQLDSQRHDYSYSGDGSGNQGNEISSGLNQFSAVATQFHRTDSEISNTSLSTFNMPNSEDDDGRKYIQETENVGLAQRDRKDKDGSTVNPLAGARTMVEQHDNQDMSRQFMQQQVMGDYSGFNSSSAYAPPNLPLDSDIRSPDGDLPDSAGSGGSGGSSGLADWEIVPPQIASVSIGHNSSLDNSTVFLDKPDGGLSMSSNYANIEHQGKPSQGSQSLSAPSDQTAHPGFRNLNPSEHSLTPKTLAPFVHEPVQSHPVASRQSSSSSVSGFTGIHQKDLLPYTSQPPSQVFTDSTLTVASNILRPLSQTDGAFRKDAGPKQAIITQPTDSGHPLTLRGDAWPDEKKTSTTAYQNLDSGTTRGIMTAPSVRPIPSATSLAEDGNRVSRRDSDHSINSTDTSQAKGIFHRTEEAPVSDLQQQHHSAFQPVGRPQQTAISPPATALWDSSEVPTANILLAPVVPLIIPALNPYSVSASSTATTNAVETSTAGKVVGNEKTRDKPTSRVPDTYTGSSAQSRVNENKGKRERGKDLTGTDDTNHSYDSLDEFDAPVEGQRTRNHQSQNNKARESSYNSYYRQDADRQDSDRPLSRNHRPSSRNDYSSQYQYDQPANRAEAYSKEDPYRRHRGYYKDYGDGSYDERYDRPRSRQDESHGSRPSSRSTQEPSRPRSRADYDRDRDYYYRARHRGYSYDNYGSNADYYNEERERYYRYNKEKEARYTRAYYEEYYGTKYADYYQQLKQHQLLQQQQQQQHGGRLSSQDFDQSSSHSQSRGSTPAIDASTRITPSPGPDYYGNRDSRPTSRTDYSREHYNRGYPYEGYNAYYDGYGYDPYAYGYGYSGHDEYSQGQNQGRMTPPKYSYPHVRASFGPGGQLVKVLPNRPKDGQPAILDIQDIQMILASCPEAEEHRMFPGPLTRTTHKKDVLLFCQQKARSCSDDINMIDRESAQLIWRFLELLIKQNGSVVGTDLSDLLLEGHEPSTHEYSLHGMKISQSSEALDTVPEGSSEDTNSARESPAVRVVSDRTVVNVADREREKLVDRFRHLLLYGRKKDALECAMKNNLWGHALFLASKMDARTHANVMTRFANSAMRMNDPLQTLYQLMSGRQPAAVTCVVDERWGDWRPHLAMILSNQSSKHDIDRKSITTLGDTLAAKGYLYASHFCYLMAQVNFGNYFKKTSKIVLIGTSHNLPMEEFASNEAIQCTEVYEYAQRLGNPAFCLPHLQIYKYLYACRLVDYGMMSEALHYCEVIASIIQQNPTWFQAPFARLLCQLSRKLQYADPQYQITGAEVTDQLWLQQLESICGAYDDGSIQPLSGKATPVGIPGTTTSSESGEYSQFGYGYSADATATNMASSAPGINAYGRQQLLPENTNAQDVSAITGQIQNLDIADQQPEQQGYSHLHQQQGYYQQQQYEYSQWQQPYSHNYTDNGDQQQQHQQQAQHTVAHQQFDVQQQHHHQSAQHRYGGSVAVDNDYSDVAESNNYTDDVSSFGGSHLDSSSSSNQLASQLHSQDYGGYEVDQQLPARASISTTEASDEEGGGNDNDDDEIDGPSTGFDYFGNVGTQKVVAPPHRYRSMSGSSAGSTRRRRTTSGSSTGSVKVSPHKPATQQPSGGKGGDKAPKGSQQDNGGSGWFGGLFNKFKVKGKNEMILPDDKNPPIVWDPVKKKWTNADGTEEYAAPKLPPPKDTELLGNPTSAAPTFIGSPPPSAATEGNRFSLKSKGVRNQYVDVNNPTPVSVPQSLFNVMPGSDPLPAAASYASTTASQAFPGSGLTSSTETKNTDSIIVDNRLALGPDPDSRSSDVPFNVATANVAHHAPSLPVLFNPAVLKRESTGGHPATSAAGPGLKYGQRRAYPK